MSGLRLAMIPVVALLSMGGCPQKTPTATSGSTTTTPTTGKTTSTSGGGTTTTTASTRQTSPDGRLQAIDAAGNPIFDATGNAVWEPPPEEQAKQLFEEAVMLAKGVAGAPPNKIAAIDRLARATQLLPAFAEAWYDLGRLQVDLNQYSAAEASLKKATELKPDLLDAWLLLGITYERAGRLTPAEASYAKALGQDGKNVAALNGMARVLRVRGRSQEAADRARAILEINANSLDAYNTLGLAYLDMGELELARFVFLKAEASVPGGDKSASIQANLGLVWFKMGKEYEATERFERARTLDPDHVGATVNLAYLKLQNFDFEGARGLLEAATQRLPGSIPIKLDLAVAYRGTGEKDKAKALLDEIVASQSEYQDEGYLNLGILLADFYSNWDGAMDAYRGYIAAVERQGGTVAADDPVHNYIKEVERAKKRGEKKKAQQPAPGAPQ